MKQTFYAVLGTPKGDATELKSNEFESSQFLESFGEVRGERKRERSPSMRFQSDPRPPETHRIENKHEIHLLGVFQFFLHVAKLSNTNTKLIKKNILGRAGEPNGRRMSKEKSLKHDKYAFELNNL
jgi:hypothetical protein